MKRFLSSLLLGFILGCAITGLFSPTVIAWYFDPPTSIGVTCKEAVVWGIVAYQKLLIVGGVIGLILAAIIFVAITNKKKSMPAI